MTSYSMIAIELLYECRRLRLHDAMSNEVDTGLADQEGVERGGAAGGTTGTGGGAAFDWLCGLRR